MSQSGVFIVWVLVIEGRVRELGMFPGRNYYIIILRFLLLDGEPFFSNEVRDLA